MRAAIINATATAIKMDTNPAYMLLLLVNHYRSSVDCAFSYVESAFFSFSWLIKLALLLATPFIMP